MTSLVPMQASSFAAGTWSVQPQGDLVVGEPGSVDAQVPGRC